jgi:hypothetical protein
MHLGEHGMRDVMNLFGPVAGPQHFDNIRDFHCKP